MGIIHIDALINGQVRGLQVTCDHSLYNLHFTSDHPYIIYLLIYHLGEVVGSFTLKLALSPESLDVPAGHQRSKVRDKDQAVL